LKHNYTNTQATDSFTESLFVTLLSLNIVEQNRWYKFHYGTTCAVIHLCKSTAVVERIHRGIIEQSVYWCKTLQYKHNRGLLDSKQKYIIL